MKKNNQKSSICHFHSSIYRYSNRHRATFSLILKFILVAFIFFNIFQTVSQVPSKYFSFNFWQRFPEMKKLYYNSIYVNKHGLWLADEQTYSFAGGYLIKGGNPILVNPEVPPFGKYLIGLSALVFDNENIINLFLCIFSLIVLFIFGKQIFSSTLIALIAPAALSSEPVFLNQLYYSPLLDIIQLFFIFLCFYFFNKSLAKKKNTFLYFFIAAMFIGLIISTKFFGIGAPVVISLFLVLLYNKDVKKMLKLILTLPLSILILLLSYSRVLVLGYPFHKFLGIQHWVFWYNQGHVHTLLSVWPLLLINKWYILWSKPPIFDPQWRVTWPILIILTMLTSLAYLLKKIPPKKEVEIFIAWIISYLAFLSIGNASARYFVILIPMMYIIAIFGLYHLVKRILKGKFKEDN